MASRVLRAQGAARRPPHLESPMENRDWRRALAAAMERILPGAVAAGVPEHVAFWLREEKFVVMRRDFKLAAVQLDRVARQENRRAFADCSPDEQAGILRRFQEDTIKGKNFSSAGVFQRLVEFSVEGFLADPKYGGNRDRIGWRFIGFSPCWWAPKRLRRILHPQEGLMD